MKLHLAHTTGRYAFTGYGEGYVQVNGSRFENSLVLMPDRLIPDWTNHSIEMLGPGDLDVLRGLGAEIVLLGTGRTLLFPDRKLLQSFSTSGIGLEVMDTGAACRTYNILLAEGRMVAAALII